VIATENRLRQYYNLQKKQYRFLLGNNKTCIENIMRDLCGIQETQPIDGALYSDPNGPSKDSFPYHKIVRFAKVFPRVDIILNVNYLSIKRTMGVVNSNRKSKNGQAVRLREYKQTVRSTWGFSSVKDIVTGIPRGHWLISDPTNVHKGGRFVLLMGTNKDLVDSVFGFHNLKSANGERLLQHVT